MASITRTVTSIILSLVVIACWAHSAGAISISPTDAFAWGENIGWLNWGTPEGNVDVPDGGGPVTGYVWGENIGWIWLGGVVYGSDELSGYGWGENVGWISFSCLNTASCGVADFGVHIDNATGVFSGYAWGENIGWISTNCTDTGSCGTVSYRVSLSSPPEQPSGNNGGSIPFPTATPIFSPTPFPSPTPTPVVLPPAGVTPGPLPTVTPIGTPPTTGPSSGPPTDTPPFIGALDNFGSWLDDLFERFLALFGPWATELCGVNALQSIACSVTALGIIALLGVIIAALLLNELLAALFFLLLLFGFRRKARVWGVVYDSTTKRPIPFAKVQLFNEAGHRLETRYANRDGRYGFLTTPKSDQAELRVTVSASKPGYVFPSTKMLGDVDYVVYDRLYQGGLITLHQGGPDIHNIPMDPVAGQKRFLSGLGTTLMGTMGDRLLAFAFFIGLIVVPLNYFQLPTTANLVMMLAFFLVFFTRWLLVFRPYGITVDGTNGKPVAFALVTLNDVNGNRVNFAVSDEHGRYVLRGKPGQTYEVAAYTPAATQPQRMVKSRTRVLRGRGWVTERITI